MTVDDLIERLREALAERERRIDRRERDAELRAEPRERWEQHHYAAAERLERLRTIHAHRKVIERYETTALVSHAAADGTLLAGAARLSLRIHRETVELLASIYFPEGTG
jgi:hypothetical protein